MSTKRGIQRRPTAQTQQKRSDPEAFINEAGGSGSIEQALDALKAPEEPEKERVIPFNLRLPQSIHARLEGISKATGKSMHEVCMTLLIPALEEAHRRYVV